MYLFTKTANSQILQQQILITAVHMEHVAYKFNISITRVFFSIFYESYTAKSV